MRHVAALSGAAVGLTAAALAACDAPRPPRPELWTVADVQRLYQSGAKTPSDAIATDAGLPGGVPLKTILNGDQVSLAVQPAWAEKYAVGYVTTEVWAHFDRVWAQPVYVPVASWSNGVPAQPSQSPIFSVGADSLFYSPFWQMVYVEVADGSVTSTREILDGKYPLHPSKPWTAALTPPNVGPVDPSRGPVIPSGGGVMGTGWLDGAAAPFVKFPKAPFGIGAEKVIDEVPIFHFVFVTAEGSWVAPEIPAVLGAGPLYSGTPAPLDGDGFPTPAYSAYWRVYVVVLPATARVFAPPGSPTEGALMTAGVPNPAEMYGDDIKDAPDKSFFDIIYGRVATNPDCFSTIANIHPTVGTKCIYLDSQQAIEGALPKEAIVATDVTVTCPLVSINGTAIQP